jgi:hypothetical protein
MRTQWLSQAGQDAMPMLCCHVGQRNYLPVHGGLRTELKTWNVVVGSERASNAELQPTYATQPNFFVPSSALYPARTVPFCHCSVGCCVMATNNKINNGYGGGEDRISCSNLASETMHSHPVPSQNTTPLMHFIQRMSGY